MKQIMGKIGILGILQYKCNVFCNFFFFATQPPHLRGVAPGIPNQRLPLGQLQPCFPPHPQARTLSPISREASCSRHRTSLSSSGSHTLPNSTTSPAAPLTQGATPPDPNQTINGLSSFREQMMQFRLTRVAIVPSLLLPSSFTLLPSQ